MNDNRKDAKAKKLRFGDTRLPDIQQSLIRAYGSEKGGSMYDAAEDILAAELATVNDRGSRMVGKHLRFSILPGYACYRAMKDMGISGEEAVAFIQGELCRGAQRMANFSKKLSTKKHIFVLFRPIMKAILKYEYPKQGWTINVLEDNKDRYRFDMTSCVYCEALCERGAQELCPAYCYTDVVSYAPLAPAVLFTRTQTLAKNDAKCDFCFTRGTGK